MLRALVPRWGLRQAPQARFLGAGRLADPGKPKRALSPYLRFAQHYRQQHSGEKHSVQVVAGKWKSLTAQEAEPFLEEYRREKEARDKEMEAYRASGQEDYFKRDPARPKKPLTPYLAWAQEARKQPQYAALKLVDSMKALKPDWEKLGEPEKERLQERFKAEQEAYQAALAKYNASGQHEEWLRKTGRQAKLDAAVAKARAKAAKLALAKEAAKARQAVARERAAAREARRRHAETAKALRQGLREFVADQKDKLGGRVSEAKARKQGLVDEEKAKKRSKEDTLTARVKAASEAVVKAIRDKKPTGQVEKAQEALREAREKRVAEAKTSGVKIKHLQADLKEKLKELTGKTTERVKERRSKAQQALKELEEKRRVDRESSAQKIQDLRAEIKQKMEESKQRA